MTDENIVEVLHFQTDAVIVFKTVITSKTKASCLFQNMIRNVPQLCLLLHHIIRKNAEDVYKRQVSLCAETIRAVRLL